MAERRSSQKDSAAVVVESTSYHHNGCLGLAVRALVDNSGEIIDWLEEFGTIRTSIAALSESYQVWYLPTGEGRMPTIVGGVPAVTQEARRRVWVRSFVLVCLWRDGRGKRVARGVCAESSNGEVGVNAKTVILASG